MRELRRLSIATTIAILAGSAALLASFHDLTGWADGTAVYCHAYAEGDGVNIVAIEVRLYAPNGALLDHDAVFDVDNDVWTTISGFQVGSGTYTCWAEYDLGTSGQPQATRYVVVP